MKNVINRALAAKKKIFLGILAVCAIVLSSCGGDEPHMKNFKVEFTETTPNKVSFTVTPADNMGQYVIGIINKKFFDKWGIADDPGKAGLHPYSGDISYSMKGLYPASEYVLVIIPVIPNPDDSYYWKRAGKTEYVFFTTPDWPRIDENGSTYTKNGTIDYEGGLLKLRFDEPNARLSLLLEVDKKITETFTKKSLSGTLLVYDYSGCMFNNYSSYYEYNGTEFPIYDVECKGIFDGNLNKYVYEGWFIRSDSKNEKGIREHFKLTCDLVE